MKKAVKVLGIIAVCIGFYCYNCYAAGDGKATAPDITILKQMVKDLTALREQRSKEVEELFSKMNMVLELLSRPSAQESLSVASYDAAKKEFAVAANDLLTYFSGATQSKKLADAESRIEKIRWTVVSTPGAAR
jgi:hypothetical protein